MLDLKDVFSVRLIIVVCSKDWMEWDGFINRRKGNWDYYFFLGKVGFGWLYMIFFKIFCFSFINIIFF